MFTPNSVKNDITFANRFICFNLCRDMIVINVRQINHFQCFICLLATCSILLIHYIHIQFFRFLWYIDYTI